MRMSVDKQCVVRSHGVAERNFASPAEASCICTQHCNANACCAGAACTPVAHVRAQALGAVHAHDEPQLERPAAARESSMLKQQRQQKCKTYQAACSSALQIECQ